jgi:serine/threonine protein kinase
MAASPIPASRHDHYKLTGVKVIDQVLETGPYTSNLELEYMGLKCVGKKIHQALFMQGETATKVRQLKEQCRLLSQVRHPNFVMFLGLFFQESPILVIEYVPYNLASCIEQYSLLPSEVSFSILHDVAVGLSYFHNLTPPIIHGDLCANNVLLTSNMRAKIVYLGVTKILQLTKPEINYMAKTNGTSVYMSPEAITDNHEDQGCSCSTDIFSFGVMVDHVMKGRRPVFESHSNQAILITISFSEHTTCNDTNEVDIRMKELVLRCTNKSSLQRPQAEELVKIFAGMVSKYPPSFINRMEMLNQIRAHKKLKIDEREERDLQKKVKRVKDQVLGQKQEMDRLMAENESLKQQLTSDDIVMCKTITNFQKHHAEQEQQNNKVALDAQDQLGAEATGEAKQYGPKPRIVPRKKVPLRETHVSINIIYIHTLERCSFLYMFLHNCDFAYHCRVHQIHLRVKEAIHKPWSRHLW